MKQNKARTTSINNSNNLIRKQHHNRDNGGYEFDDNLMQTRYHTSQLPMPMHAQQCYIPPRAF